jgi:hypothetical protein
MPLASKHFEISFKGLSPQAFKTKKDWGVYGLPDAN